ncbi:hypothetical protein FQA47_001272 [Oryzias melastigma]|uniref:Fibronectin type-III domain-containing protein n=1 Tax=Oryzias melastigma TaxID=30732 RepID=A0A834CD98_ORYME|nr:hypothetical protein FQA47_001272 [Oryzias melastigma]
MLLRTFTAALLISWGLSRAALCPENVMVSCENLIIMARWDCEGQQPETSFKVKISSIYMGVLHEVITKDNEYDLSHVVWKSKEICLSFLYVTVTALHGGNESTEIKSKSFSFNTQETVYANCLLEFPPATLVVNESRAVVTFPNPFLFYKEINQVYKESDFQLIFSVNFGENISVYSFQAPCPENVMVSCENLKIMARWDCKERHPETSFRVKILSYNKVLHEDITKDSEYDLSHVVWKSKDICLSFLYVAVTALHGGNESEEAKSNTFSFSTPKTVLTLCLLEFPPVSLVVEKKRAVVKFPNPFRFYKEIKDEGFILLIALLFVFGVILSVAIIAICKVRAWTTKSPPLPKPLDFKKNLSYKDNFDGEISAVSIYKSPEKVIDEDVCRVPLQHKESKDPSSVSGNNLIDGNSSVSSTKTETLSMSLEDYNDDDEEEEYRSPYESREPVLCQDMGDGDIVITYTGT